MQLFQAMPEASKQAELVEGIEMCIKRFIDNE